MFLVPGTKPTETPAPLCQGKALLAVPNSDQGPNVPLKSAEFLALKALDIPCTCCQDESWGRGGRWDARGI